MKSTLLNMVLSLFCITLVSSACVGVVNMITASKIEEAKAAAAKRALAQVLPEFDTTESSEHTADELTIVAHKATKGGEVVGYAIETSTKSGFSGLIRMMVGFDVEGRILNVNVLEQNETPGLGAKMTEEGNPLLVSIQGKEASKINLTVKKDGGDVDALTAATISSRAYAEAVARAYAVFKVAAGWQSDVQATTGATQTKKEE
ncbi:MAG: RnfABCDGE type electron transport complex subunit G [Alistipes sp.]|nr:RnfABCDGE type electron transport complex subunit G [Alistipes sp.]